MSMCNKFLNFKQLEQQQNYKSKLQNFVNLKFLNNYIKKFKRPTKHIILESGHLYHRDK